MHLPSFASYKQNAPIISPAKTFTLFFQLLEVKGLSRGGEKAV